MSLFFWLNLPTAAIGVVALVFGIRAEVRATRADQAFATDLTNPIVIELDSRESARGAAHTLSQSNGGSI